MQDLVMNVWRLLKEYQTLVGMADGIRNLYLDVQDLYAFEDWLNIYFQN